MKARQVSTLPILQLLDSEDRSILERNSIIGFNNLTHLARTQAEDTLTEYLIMTRGLIISNIRIRWHYKLNKERNNITTAHLISQILHKIEETYLEERVQEKWGFRKDRRCKKHPITGAKTNSLCPKMIATQLIIVFKY